MTAECWGCARSIAGLAGVPLPSDPLGVCWDCHVFGCAAHAEKDRASGKWLCLPSVANALAYSAGLDQHLDLPTSLTFANVSDYRRRFPHVFVTVRRAMHEGVSAMRDGDSVEVRAMDGERASSLASEVGAENHPLLAEAILLGSILVPMAPYERLTIEGHSFAPAVLAEGLAMLVREVRPA
jgi:hypothetical protein